MAASATQLFPLTFKENSMISNPAETARYVGSSFEYYNIMMMRVTSILAQSLR